MSHFSTAPPTVSVLNRRSQVITFFRAHAVKKVSQGGGDESENIQVHVVPLTELKLWMDSRRREGCLVDYKVLAALYLEIS